ncbi:T-cell activation protein phosphatase 2C [Thraustotheca clavata]|uniref:Protein phosphatase n=1 Tax=Thraustotheca clavata TaxID=74557 RepID=A0A1V9YS59_9STRA|nr:T-cell activation protein phosphatase 2C [Thraustotheca clavata]
MRLFVSVAGCVALAWADGSQGTCSLDAHGQSSCGKAKFGYEIGVGCKPKKLRQVSKAPNANAARNCGEDAYSVASGDKYLSIGIADGVGGWTESGVDPSAFSLALVSGSKDAFEKSTVREQKPLDLMKKGYEVVVSGGDANPGGSTAVFLVLDKETGYLDTANLGDSGYLIVRNGALLFRSVEQTWAFNAPYQLSLYPTWMHSPDVDPYSPDDSFLTNHVVKAGDVVIIGSDGLFDNVFDHEILDETQRFLDAVYKKHPMYYEQINENDADPLPILSKTAQEFQQAMIDLSYSLTLMANSFAHDQGRESPFSKLAREGYGYQFNGGKVDDTTVISPRFPFHVSVKPAQCIMSDKRRPSIRKSSSTNPSPTRHELRRGSTTGRLTSPKKSKKLSQPILVDDIDKREEVVTMIAILEQESSDAAKMRQIHKLFDWFKMQYNALSASLRESLQREQQLVATCRDLKAELLLNVTKLQTKLQVFDTQTESLAFFKAECERSWQSIHESHHREQEALEIISDLRGKISKLEGQVKELQRRPLESRRKSITQSLSLGQLRLRSNDLEQDPATFNEWKAVNNVWSPPKTQEKTNSLYRGNYPGSPAANISIHTGPFTPMERAMTAASSTKKRVEWLQRGFVVLVTLLTNNYNFKLTSVGDDIPLRAWERLQFVAYNVVKALLHCISRPALD